MPLFNAMNTERWTVILSLQAPDHGLEATATKVCAYERTKNRF